MSFFFAYSPFAFGSGLQYEFVEVEPYQSLPLFLTGQPELNHLVQAVVDSGIELLRRVWGQHQHYPGALVRGSVEEGVQRGPQVLADPLRWSLAEEGVRLVDEEEDTWNI